MDGILLFGALSSLSLLAMVAYQERRILSLRRRATALERQVKRLQCLIPIPQPYRAPPECEECPASHPGVCQACHEEARKGG